MFLFLKDPTDKLAKKPLIDILQKVENVPTKWRVAVRNNGGG